MLNSTKIKFAILLLGLSITYISTQNIFLSAFDFLRRGDEELRLENMDNKPMEAEYDFIVVGAGTAGCAVAARLSENQKWKVLLLEAGQHESLIMDIPIIAHFLQLGSMNWKYRAQPSKNACLAMNNNRCNWPRGKVMGGSSVLNYMMYTRGNRRDYDRWAELGNPGWSYKDVLPYFKKFEDSSVSDAEPDYVGHGGPVSISYVNWRSKIADAFVEASKEAGLPYRDYNGKIQIGVSFLQTTTKNATRCSSNRAYLYPLKGLRPNLNVKKSAFVTKILIDPKTKTAYGVVVDIQGQKYKIRASKEVIVAAGAINSPQLLMLSGIGPAQHLKEVGVKPIIADLAVGFNLQDHTAAAVTFATNASSLHFEDLTNPMLLHDFMNHNGPYGSPGGCETISFYSLDDPKNPDGWPDIELFMISASISANPAISRAIGLRPIIYETMFREIEEKYIDAFMIVPMVLRPKSRGRIMLKTIDPYKHPIIHANYFDHPYDIDMAVRGLLKAISLMEQPGFKKINAKLWNRPLQPCLKFGFKSRKYWECYARYFTLTIYHYSGTCKMGPSSDPTAVVDSKLKVHGVNNLRVIDASIMPEIIAGHPNGPTFMIAENGADMIKKDYGFIK